MSKGSTRRKTSSIKDSAIGDRLSDDEANRRRPCYQLIEKERQRKLVTMNDLRKSQLGILQEILFNQRNVHKFVPKNHTVRNAKSPKARPTSAKNLNTFDCNRSVHSAGEEVPTNGPARVSRSSKRDNRLQAYRMTRSRSHHCSIPARSATNVSFVSDNSNLDPSPGQFKKLLVNLSSELNNLESITGFKSNRNDLSSYSSSTALATALIRLVGHVKQYGSNSKEINNLKDQLSIVIKSQLDFQEKIDHQITTLQTMMQTICQVVNNEMISNRKPYRDQTDFDRPGSHQNWLNNAQRPYLIEKDTTNAMDELLIFTRRMNNGSPVDTNLHHSPSNNRHSAYIETLEASKRLTRPTSAVSTNGKDMSKQTQQHRKVDQTLCRSSMISPIDMPFLELPLPNRNSSASPSETILEKILQERLRLVQQMSELNKQHEMTQEELANLEAKTTQT